MAPSVVIDASAVIAVVTNEPHKPTLIRLTEGVELLSPSSLPLEVGNAFSAMFKRRSISLAEAKAAVEAYKRIAIRRQIGPDRQPEVIRVNPARFEPNLLTRLAVHQF